MIVNLKNGGKIKFQVQSPISATIPKNEKLPSAEKKLLPGAPPEMPSVIGPEGKS